MRTRGTASGGSRLYHWRTPDRVAHGTAPDPALPFLLPTGNDANASSPPGTSFRPLKIDLPGLQVARIQSVQKLGPASITKQLLQRSTVTLLIVPVSSRKMNLTPGQAHEAYVGPPSEPVDVAAFVETASKLQDGSEGQCPLPVYSQSADALSAEMTRMWSTLSEDEQERIKNECWYTSLHIAIQFYD